MEEIRGKENHFANSYVILTLVSQTIPKELLNLREILCVYFANAGFPGGSAVKNPPAMQEMLVPSLGWEDPLEKEMATHSSILAWEIPWTEDPDGLSVVTNHHHHHHHFANDWCQIWGKSSPPLVITEMNQEGEGICIHLIYLSVSLSCSLLKLYLPFWV